MLASSANCRAGYNEGLDEPVSSEAQPHPLTESSLEGELRKLEDRQSELRSQVARCLQSLEQLAVKQPAGDSRALRRIAIASQGDPPSDLRELQVRCQYLQAQINDLDRRCRAVAELSATNTERIGEILDSRTWQLLTRAGGVILRLLGK